MGQGQSYTAKKESPNQGDPPAMVTYDIGLFPIIRKVKAEFLDVEQPWYVNDTRAGGPFDGIRAYFHQLQEIGPKLGCYPELDWVVSHSLATF
jgi:hypothetical protein